MRPAYDLVLRAAPDRPGDGAARGRAGEPGRAEADGEGGGRAEILPLHRKRRARAGQAVRRKGPAGGARSAGGGAPPRSCSEAVARLRCA